MKMFDKIKELFTDEVEIETPIKKEVIQVEIPAPESPKKEVEEDFKETNEEVKEPKKTQEDKFNYPVFFDEKDFDDINKLEETMELKREIPKETHREVVRDTYSVKKEEKTEKKRFTPTPIISPVYGQLDKNYRKDDIVDKQRRTYKQDTNMTIDDVRNKAYGTLEDELESTLFGRTSIMFASREEKSTDNHDYTDIEDDLEVAANALDLLGSDPDFELDLPNEEYKEEKNEDTKSSLDSLDEILNAKYELPEENVEDEEADNMVSDILNNDFETDDKLSESDLFNLIDDMYEKGDK